MTSYSKETWTGLCQFVREQLGDVGSLSPISNLQRDLQLDGDDAFEFMEAYAEWFGVSKGDFAFEDYFGAEGLNPISLVRALLRRSKPTTLITLEMLARAAG